MFFRRVCNWLHTYVTAFLALYRLDCIRLIKSRLKGYETKFIWQGINNSTNIRYHLGSAVWKDKLQGGRVLSPMSLPGKFIFP